MNRKKRIFALLVMLALAGSTEAQIFNTNSDGNDMRSQTNLFELNGFGNTTTDGNNESLNNNEINTPIGSGLLLMAGMAGAYAMMRRRKDESEK